MQGRDLVGGGKRWEMGDIYNSVDKKIKIIKVILKNIVNTRRMLAAKYLFRIASFYADGEDLGEKDKPMIYE